MTDFETTVLEDLATLKSEMKALVGNGQPGRLRLLESKVEEHETTVQRVAGSGVVLGALLTLVHLAIDYLKSRH